MKKSDEYFSNLIKILSDVAKAQMPAIDKCSGIFAEALENNRTIFLFGTGHSHMLAEELFYRAGGLVKLQPVLETSLMLHESASKSTEIERLEGYAEILFKAYRMQKGDVIVIASNSGRNGIPVDMALLAKKNGLTVIALTSIKHSSSGASRHKSGKRLFEIADIVLDNMGEPGDASVSFPELGRKACPTSTSVGAAILHAVVAGAIEIMLRNGIIPEVYSSSNVDGGDAINEAYIEKYKDTIKSL